MLGVDFNSKSVAEMSLQYLSKPSDPPPSYNSQARRAAHDYLQNEQSNIDNKTQQQQHSINDILNTGKQGKCNVTLPSCKGYNTYSAVIDKL